MTSFIAPPLVGRVNQQTLTGATPYAVDLSLGEYIIVPTLTSDITLNNPINSIGPALYIFAFTQDGVGGHAVNYGTAYKNGTAPATGINTTTYVAFMADGLGNLWALTSSTSGSSGVQSITAGANVQITGPAATPTLSATESGLLIPTTADASLLGNASPNMIAETLARDDFSSQTQTVNSGQISYFKILLVKGTLVTFICFLSGNTALTHGTNNDAHQFFVLYDKHGNALAVTTDDTNTAWAANTFKSLNIDRFATGGPPPTAWGASGSGPYTIPSTDFYYLGCMVNMGTGGTPVLPTFAGTGLQALTAMFKPAMAFTDTTHAGLTVPTGAPFVATPANPAGGRIYGGIG